MQRNWIGRSEGLPSASRSIRRPRRRRETELEIFTTRPDTLFGAKFMASRPIIRWRRRARRRRIRSSPPSSRMQAPLGTSAEAIETAEKLGFDTGIRACIPSIRAWTLPVYVANFILMEYGTGAIFGCPAHDQRDLDFATNTGSATRPSSPAGRIPRASSSRTRPMTATGG
jgi:leucyl-tRNA synthetase